MLSNLFVKNQHFWLWIGAKPLRETDELEKFSSFRLFGKQSLRLTLSWLEVENNFTQSQTGLRTTHYLKNYWFLRHRVKSKTIYSISKRNGPARPVRFLTTYFLNAWKFTRLKVLYTTWIQALKFTFEMENEIFLKVLKL